MHGLTQTTRGVTTLVPYRIRTSELAPAPANEIALFVAGSMNDPNIVP
jgi:hypothetical protein